MVSTYITNLRTILIFSRNCDTFKNNRQVFYDIRRIKLISFRIYWSYVFIWTTFLYIFAFDDSCISNESICQFSENARTYGNQFLSKFYFGYIFINFQENIQQMIDYQSMKYGIMKESCMGRECFFRIVLLFGVNQDLKMDLQHLNPKFF